MNRPGRSIAQNEAAGRLEGFETSGGWWVYVHVRDW
jgi:hypothetical protein